LSINLDTTVVNVPTCTFGADLCYAIGAAAKWERAKQKDKPRCTAQRGLFGLLNCQTKNLGQDHGNGR